MNTKQIIPAILVLGMILLTIGTAAALPRTFDGHIICPDGTPCTNVTEVRLVNNNTGAEWNQSTIPMVQISGSLYITVLDDPNDVTSGDVFNYYITGNCSSGTFLTNTTTRTYTGAPGISFNITLDAPAGPDLVVSSIDVNPHHHASYDDYYFANESNRICATITNIGGANATNISLARFNVSSPLSGTHINSSVKVKALNISESVTVCITDPTRRKGSADWPTPTPLPPKEIVNIIVTADWGNNVTEGNELNNVTNRSMKVLNHGMKGKQYTSGQNMSVWTVNGSLVYSPGNSKYQSGSQSTPPGWSTYDAAWTAKEPGVPAGATVKAAKLYVMYTWDKNTVMVDKVSTTFTSATFSGNIDHLLEQHYMDTKYFADNPVYGMHVYNVTNEYAPGTHSAQLINSDPGGGNVSIRGMMLVVAYDNPCGPTSQIFVAEGFDYLYGGFYSGYSVGTTYEEATAWAEIGPVTVTDPKWCSQLVTFAPGADGSLSTGEGELIFNGQTWNDEWRDNEVHQIGISNRCVTNELNTSGGNNSVGFQSREDWMEASNAFLMVTEGADASVETATKVGYASFSVDQGGATCGVTAIDASGIPNKPSRTFPFGLFGIQITSLTPGDTVNVTITLPANVTSDYEYWKVNTTAGNNTWYPYNYTILGGGCGSNVIKIQLTDGGAGDHDGVADGNITDPGGLASSTVQLAIDQPTYVQPQQQFTINITVDPQGNDVSAVQYDLYYNTSVVWAEWANPGTFLSRSGPTEVNVLQIYNEWDVANHIGKISYAETTKGDPLPSVNTPGVLTTIHFSAIGVRGTSTYFNFEDVLMSDPDKNPVDVTITNCGVEIYDNNDPVADGASMHRFSNVASKFQCFAVLCPCLSNAGGDVWKGNNITYIRWDFGDGQYGTSEGISLLNPCNVKEHEYTTWNWIVDPSDPDGGYYANFTAYLTVRDDGCPPASNTAEVPVMVYIAGDTNGDGKVNVFDLASVGKHWGQSATGPSGTCDYYWTDSHADEADLNNDKDVDTIDAMIVGTNWNHLAYPPYYQE